nr:hypothetical protein [Tanacetum cinerariifolium]
MLLWVVTVLEVSLLNDMIAYDEVLFLNDTITYPDFVVGLLRLLLLLDIQYDSAMGVDIIGWLAMMTSNTNGALFHGVPRLARQPCHTCGCGHFDGGFVKIVTRSGVADEYLAFRYQSGLKNSPPSLTAWNKGVELVIAGKTKQS